MAWREAIKGISGFSNLISLKVEAARLYASSFRAGKVGWIGQVGRQLQSACSLKEVLKLFHIPRKLFQTQGEESLHSELNPEKK